MKNIANPTFTVWQGLSASACMIAGKSGYFTPELKSYSPDAGFAVACKVYHFRPTEKTGLADHLVELLEWCAKDAVRVAEDNPCITLAYSWKQEDNTPCPVPKYTICLVLIMDKARDAALFASRNPNGLIRDFNRSQDITLTELCDMMEASK